MWGRQSYRFSDFDFEANAKDGFGVDWPIRYKDIAPWYDHVEKFAGISGNKDGLPQLPDGQFLPPMDLNVVEKHVAEGIKKHYNGKRVMTIGRTANSHRARARQNTMPVPQQVLAGMPVRRVFQHTEQYASCCNGNRQSHIASLLSCYKSSVR